LFFSEIAKRSSGNNFCVSPIESDVFAIKLDHAMAGIEACPVRHSLVKFALEGTKIRLARPVQPKEPLLVNTVQSSSTPPWAMLPSSPEKKLKSKVTRHGFCLTIRPSTQTNQASFALCSMQLPNSVEHP